MDDTQYESRAERRFEQAESFVDGSLNSRGKKNAKHADEIRREVELTRQAAARFLLRRLPEIDPDGWEDNLVRKQLEIYQSYNPQVKIPTHADVANFDLRGILALIEQNLDLLEFERGETVTFKETKRIGVIRNNYVHFRSGLNHCDWERDIETLKVFRSKMQSDRDIEEETYSLDDLPEMQRDTESYIDRLEVVQKQIDSVFYSVMSLEGRVTDIDQTDTEQTTELERQRGEDFIHTTAITRLVNRDQTQRKWIIGLVALGTINLAATVVAILKK